VHTDPGAERRVALAWLVVAWVAGGDIFAVLAELAAIFAELEAPLRVGVDHHDVVVPPGEVAVEPADEVVSELLELRPGVDDVLRLVDDEEEVDLAAGRGRIDAGGAGGAGGVLCVGGVPGRGGGRAAAFARAPGVAGALQVRGRGGIGGHGHARRRGPGAGCRRVIAAAAGPGDLAVRVTDAGIGTRREHQEERHKRCPK
jgi:hypothetical protein